MTISWFSCPAVRFGKPVLQQQLTCRVRLVRKPAEFGDSVRAARLAKALCSRNVRELCKLGFRKVHAFPGKAVTVKKALNRAHFLAFRA
jgi:hypothetical protein